MTEETIATLCSGGEGVGVGARAAGLKHIWGIEIRDDVAQVARDNGFNVITADMRDVDPHTLEVPDRLHLSLPCLDASGANGKRIESAAGKELGRVGARYIEVLRPRVVTLENVYYYRTYEAFKTITATLTKLGYMWHFVHLCAADYGVPQERWRLILRAVRGSLLPMLPESEPWRGWYSSIEDLVETLPESKFAPWQMARLPEALKRTVLVAQGGYEGRISMRGENEPALTVTANQNQLELRAFIVNTREARRDNLTIRTDGEPVFTIPSGSCHYPKAVIISGSNASNFGANELTMRDQDEPVFTVTASTTKAPMRSIMSGRVVRMTLRALSRFQSVPDEYKLPERRRLAGYVIGNMVPPLMYQKISETFAT